MRPIPTEFTTILEALRSLCLIILGSCNWWLSKSKNTFGPSGSSGIPAMLMKDMAPLEDAPVSQHSVFMTEYEQWNAAFRALWRRAKRSLGKTDFKRAVLLRMSYLCGYLWMAAGSSNSQVTRRFTRELEEVISLSQSLMNLPSASVLDTSFSFDTRIVPPLTVVGFSYRHRACRKLVIDIFSKLKRREGLWDTCMSGKIM